MERSDEHEQRGVWSGPLQALWADLGHGAAPRVDKADSGGKGQDAVSLEPARTAVGKVTPTYRGVKSLRQCETRPPRASFHPPNRSEKMNECVAGLLPSGCLEPSGTEQIAETLSH